jgi:hypothetical protein
MQRRDTWCLTLVGTLEGPSRTRWADQLSRPTLELDSRRCFLTRTFS